MEKKIQSGSDRKRGPVVALAAAVLVSGYAQTGYAQISKGNWILINRGLQVQAMVTKDDVFHLNTYSNAYYTSIHWLGFQPVPDGHDPRLPVVALGWR